MWHRPWARELFQHPWRACCRRADYRVAIQKLDPYINVDPGTLNPYEHGECYVTEDGAETDLDLGHYERFHEYSDFHKPTTSPPGASTKALSTRNAAESFSAKPYR